MSKTFNIYCDESTHLIHDGHPYMLLGYTSIWKREFLHPYKNARPEMHQRQSGLETLSNYRWAMQSYDDLFVLPKKQRSNFRI